MPYIEEKMLRYITDLNITWSLYYYLVTKVWVIDAIFKHLYKNQTTVTSLLILHCKCNVSWIY